MHAWKFDSTHHFQASWKECSFPFYICAGYPSYIWPTTLFRSLVTKIDNHTSSSRTSNRVLVMTSINKFISINPYCIDFFFWNRKTSPQKTHINVLIKQVKPWLSQALTKRLARIEPGALRWQSRESTTAPPHRELYCLDRHRVIFILFYKSRSCNFEFDFDNAYVFFNLS